MLLFIEIKSFFEAFSVGKKKRRSYPVDSKIDFGFPTHFSFSNLLILTFQ